MLGLAGTQDQGWSGFSKMAKGWQSDQDKFVIFPNPSIKQKSMGRINSVKNVLFFFLLSLCSSPPPPTNFFFFFALGEMNPQNSQWTWAENWGNGPSILIWQLDWYEKQECSWLKRHPFSERYSWLALHSISRAFSASFPTGFETRGSEN